MHIMCITDCGQPSSKAVRGYSYFIEDNRKSKLRRLLFWEAGKQKV